MNNLRRHITFLALLMIFVESINAEIISGTITGQVIDYRDHSLICALIIINGKHQTYSCTTDGTNKGASFTLHYDYFTDSSDTSANKLLIFANGYKNETLQITQPDSSIQVQMRKIDDSLVGNWSIWTINGNNLSAILSPDLSCGYSLCSPFNIYKDEGSILEGSWTVPTPHGDGPTYHLTAIYKDSNTLQWTIEKSTTGFQYPPDCTDTGTMQRIGYNLLIVSNHTKQCWDTAMSTEYWIRYYRF